MRKRFMPRRDFYRRLRHRLEVGLGVPQGVGGAAGRIGIVGKITWEIGGD